MVNAVEQNGMDAGIGGEYLEYAARCRIAVEYAGDVFAQTLPKRHNQFIQMGE
jgi:hypothetical protein